MEDLAKQWLEHQFAEGSGEGNPQDAIFCADWVIDAFIAGMLRAAAMMPVSLTIEFFGDHEAQS